MKRRTAFSLVSKIEKVQRVPTKLVRALCVHLQQQSAWLTDGAPSSKGSIIPIKVNPKTVDGYLLSFSGLGALLWSGLASQSQTVAFEGLARGFGFQAQALEVWSCWSRIVFYLNY